MPVTLFTDAWGGGQGLIQRVTPSTRLLCGTFVFASCAASSLTNLSGIALFFGVLSGWVIGCGVPLRRLGHILSFAVCLLMPFLLLVPIICWQADSVFLYETWRVPLVITLRGTACIVVCAATLSVLNLAELGQALAGMPLPHTLAALIMQIAHQTALLTDESRRMVAALRVRGVPSATLIIRLRCIFALPVFWLLRLLLRAERVSAAMEVRGFDGPLRRERAAAVPIPDRCVLAVAVLVLTAALVLRWEAG